ncbi:MAG: HlyD family efflux transporter periplasmic adaptor subunit [Muribaculaceae bacterium]|nr:HlyD family efflux transporter periplasmic adaptor subunit [Muribaculaceae bacterium]
MSTNKQLYLLVITFMLLSCNRSDDNYSASGVFETTEVQVSANGVGEILKLDVDEGAQLDSGLIIGYIDTTQLYLKKKQLYGNLKAVDSRQYNVSKQIASLKQQISTQQKEQIRFQNLVKSNAGNQKQLDDINSQIEILQRQLNAQIEVLENGNNSVKGESMSLLAQIQLIDDQINKNIIKSPIKGVVLTKYVECGELASTGRVLFKIADIDNLFLRAYISASQLTDIKIGQKVKVYADRGEDERREYNGTISWISNKSEFTPKTIQTRDERANLVYAVKIAVKNDGYIKIGMYGDVQF